MEKILNSLNDKPVTADKNMEELIETDSDNVFILSREKKLCTKNLVQGNVYGEKLVNIADQEYRLWDEHRSKLAAVILKGYSLSLKKGFSVLYLGAANGTTTSHVSDIVSQGVVFAVEFSPRAMHDLIRVSTPRINLVPILADAMHPETYRNMVSPVDFLYQDIAQREQAKAAMNNAELFLKKNGILVLIIKSRSIDSVKKPDEVIRGEVKKLRGFLILKLIDLEPCHKDHIAVIAQKI